MAFVEVEGISKAFAVGERVAALSNFSLNVNQGELVAVLGPSGCGKSTLLRCLAGLERPEAGRITIDGGAVFTQNHWVAPEDRGIGMVFQSYALWPHMTVFDNLAFPLKMLHRPAAEIQISVDRVLSIVGLSRMGTRFPSQLSGGQQQRVALARALIANPKVLLFDEPLSNLDAKLREAMRLELRTLQRRFGWTALYVTHDRAEAMYLADRVVVLREGVIQQVGTSSELYDRPKNAFVADFMGDINFFGAVADQEGNLRPDPLAVAVGEGARTMPARFGVRPEWIRLAAATNGQPPMNAWRGRVLSATNLGWHVEYEVDIASVVIKVRGSIGETIPPGEMADVYVDTNRIHRFES